MTDEGYIKFNCEWQQESLPSFIAATERTALLQARDEVFNMGFIGFDEQQQVGFGNISIRVGEQGILISGTQTGHHVHLLEEHLSYIYEYSFERNWLKCGGQSKASSETLTHAAIYQACKSVKAVIHIHSAVLWKYYLGKLPTTPATVPYGTPEMAAAVLDLLAGDAAKATEAFVMAGHQDGMVIFSNSLKEAVLRLEMLKSEAEIR